VFLGRRSILQYVVFFFLFGIILANVNGLKNNNIAILEDTFGVRTMTSSIKEEVNTQYHEKIEAVSLGFTFHARDRAFKTFVWNGISYSGLFLFSRLLWVIIAFGLVYGSSFFFHRFDIKQSAGKRKKMLKVADKPVPSYIAPAGISMVTLPPVIADYGILPFIKTELLLLVRKGPRWFWFINAGLFIAIFFVPMEIACILLAILWFLQVSRWSELATKEKANRLHYFTYSAYKPLQRMLPAQILAGVILAITLALPLIVRYAINLNGYGIINLINGAIFIVLFAVCLGIVSGGKKLYEIFFFLLTYCIIEKLPIADYFGSMAHGGPLNYIGFILIMNVCLAIISFSVRNYQARHL